MDAWIQVANGATPCRLACRPHVCRQVGLNHLDEHRRRQGVVRLADSCCLLVGQFEPVLDARHGASDRGRLARLTGEDFGVFALAMHKQALDGRQTLFHVAEISLHLLAQALHFVAQAAQQFQHEVFGGFVHGAVLAASIGRAARHGAAV